MTYDCLIIGGGPAGLSAALQCKARNRTALLISNAAEHNPLCKAQQVDNYLGLPRLTGRVLMDTMLRHVEESQAAQLVTGRALSAMASGGQFYVTVGSEVYAGRTMVLATGIARGQVLPGEEQLLGKGVSYCAACDGMLYRGRSVAVIGLAADAPQEAVMLQKMGCQVTYIAQERPSALPRDIPFMKGKRPKILGENAVSGVSAEEDQVTCQGVFLLRDTLAPTALFPALAVVNGYIQVDHAMATNLSGVFAAGDCTGLPLQIAKAVGQGQIAAHSASQWLEEQDASQ